MKIGLQYSFQVAPGEGSETVIRSGLEDVKWADANGFPAGTTATVAAKLMEYNAALGTTVVLVCYQLPHVATGALTDCLHGPKDVMGMLARA